MYRLTDVVDSKFIKRFSYLDLFLCVKKCVGELLSFSQCTFNDLKVGDIAQVVPDGLIRIGTLGIRVCLRLYSSKAWIGSYFMMLAKIF